jgi:uncharacterized protein
MNPKYLSGRKRFPGTDSSRFDLVLRLSDALENMPAIIVIAVLIALALAASLGNLVSAFALFLFFLSDWALIAALPRARKSFGPPKPPTLMLAALRSMAALIPYPFNWIAQAMGTVFVIYGFWIEPHRVQVTHQFLQSTKIKSGSSPLRILHLGDLHIERETERDRQVVELARSLRPDVVLFTGDFLSFSNVDDPIAIEHARSILRELSAPLGVYAVTGSPPVDDLQVVPKILDGLDIRWLRDERVTVNHRGYNIDLVGITCTHEPDTDNAKLVQVLEGDPDNFTVLLYHSPDLAPDAAAQGIDLQLSGHTHGGQVRLPFFGAVFTSSLYGKRFEMGRYSIGGLTLYVTRGLGMEGKGAPRVRFLCPPEVILWEISGDPAQTHLLPHK